MIEKIVYLVENNFASPLTKIANNHYIEIIQKALGTISQYLVFNSFFILLVSLPIEWWQNLIFPIADSLWITIRIISGVISLIIAASLGYYLGEYYHQKDKAINPLNTLIVSLVSFLLINTRMMDVERIVMNTSLFGSTGIFTAIIITIISVELYHFLINKKITIKISEKIPSMVGQSFTAFIPVFSVIIVWWLLIVILKQDIHAFIMLGLNPLIEFGQSALVQFLSFFIDRLLWFVGVHGSDIVGPIMSPIWTQMISENIQAFASNEPAVHLLTSQWNNFFVRGSVLPLAILMISSKQKRYKDLGKVAIIPSIFNIAEPVIFGLPLILNPILFIPWVIGYSVIWIICYFFTIIIPIIPPVVAIVPWTIPGPIAAYLGCNYSIVAFVFSLSMYVLMLFIWWPFFKMLEKKESELTKIKSY